MKNEPRPQKHSRNTGSKYSLLANFPVCGSSIVTIETRGPTSQQAVPCGHSARRIRGMRDSTTDQREVSTVEPTQSDRNTGFEEVVVSDDGRERELRKTVEGEAPDIRGLQDYGYGTDLTVPAWDEVRDTLGDLDEYEDGQHVATIHYDLDDWSYRIEWCVERSIVRRIRGFLP